MTLADGVRYEKRERVAYITLERPEVLNAMDLAMQKRLKEIWQDFEADPQIWLGVLSGKGGKAFSVGQDLKELQRLNEAQQLKPSSFGSKGRAGYPRLTERFDISKPLIAKVDGYALGGGLELALACDIIIASERSRFALPEAKLGLIAGAGGVFRLMRQLPQKVAMGYLMTGRQFNATQAEQWGLLNEVVTHDKLDQTVQRWVEDMLACSPMSLRAIKQVAYQSLDMPLEAAFDCHYPLEEQRRDSADCLEGPLAFKEKRAPVWVGG